MGKMKRPDLNRLASMTRTSGQLSSSEALLAQKKNDLLSEYNIENIPASKLDPLPFNSEVYDVDDFDFLGATIKKYGMLQPLIVQKQKGLDRYWIIAGERRYRSYLKSREDEDAPKLYSEGLPCHVFPENMDPVEIRIVLILANATSRARSAETQVRELKMLVSLFDDASKNGVDVGFSLKELAMSQLHISERQYQKYMASFNVIPELQDAIRGDEAVLNLAAAIGAKPDDVQKEIYERYSAGESLKDAYDGVNRQYLEYKRILKEDDETIRELKAQIARLTEAAAGEADSRPVKNQVESLRKELKEKKAQKVQHRDRIREAVRKREDDGSGAKESGEHLVLDPFTLTREEAFDCVETGLRAIFIHAKSMDTETEKKLREIRDRLDQLLGNASSEEHIEF